MLRPSAYILQRHVLDCLILPKLPAGACCMPCPGSVLPWLCHALAPPWICPACVLCPVPEDGSVLQSGLMLIWLVLSRHVLEHQHVCGRPRWRGSYWTSCVSTTCDGGTAASLPGRH